MKINVKIPQKESATYEINLATGLLKNMSKLLKNLTPAEQYIIITDTNVKKMYGEKLLADLKKSGLKADILAISAGEKSKSEAMHSKLTHALLQKKCGRNTIILALGGGVIGDIAGYTAATYMRGIPYIQIPTTLLAMIDSSIGGKVGIDTKFGKNLIGAFHQPIAVIADLDCLKKLPIEEVKNGLIEAVKIFITNDKSFFELAEKNVKKLLKKDVKLLEKIIGHAIELKRDIVEKDEKEANERMTLNFGHTIGHAVEQLFKFKVPHGYCVGLGILIESRMANILGTLHTEDFLKIRKLINALGIDEKLLSKFSPATVIKQASLDKKSKNGEAKYVVLEKIGSIKNDKTIFAHPVDSNIIKQAFNFFTK